MPIMIAAPVVRPSKERFYEVDHLMTGLAFQLHNRFGRLFKESLYQTRLEDMVRDQGLAVSREVEITITFDSFSKNYFVDHLVESGVPVEIKAVDAIGGLHRSQLLNYLFLCELGHGVLLNFRTTRVQHEFVSTGHTYASRHEYSFAVGDFGPLPSGMQETKKLFRELLDDWGTHLDVSVYREALVQLSGFGACGNHDVTLYSHGVPIGVQPMAMLEESVAISVTACKHREHDMRTHLQRFINHTRLEGVLWINMYQSEISIDFVRRMRRLRNRGTESQ